MSEGGNGHWAPHRRQYEPQPSPGRRQGARRDGQSQVCVIAKTQERSRLRKERRVRRAHPTRYSRYTSLLRSSIELENPPSNDYSHTEVLVMSTQTEAIVRASVIAISLLTIIISVHVCRALVSRKFRDLFPGVKPLRRLALFNHIDPTSAPDDSSSRKFRSYMRQIMLYNFYVVAAAVTAIFLAAKL